MSGYTPVFRSVFTGTLCGRFPDTAAWLYLLALADKNGVVDMTPQYISNVTGMPVADLQGCIERFMQPDPYSRSAAEEGRRLVPVDPQRPWGWRIVNFALYREKARLQAKSVREVDSGENRDRLKTAVHRRPPPDTAADPLSNANANADTNAGKSRERRAARSDRATRLPEDFTLTEQRRAIAKNEGVEPERTFAKFSDYWRSAGGRTARKLDWDATWRNWCRTESERGRPYNGAAPQPVNSWRPPPDEDAA